MLIKINSEDTRTASIEYDVDVFISDHDTQKDLNVMCNFLAL